MEFEIKNIGYKISKRIYDRGLARGLGVTGRLTGGHRLVGHATNAENLSRRKLNKAPNAKSC